MLGDVNWEVTSPSDLHEAQGFTLKERTVLTLLLRCDGHGENEEKEVEGPSWLLSFHG